jgi:hypothetical protein
LALIATAPTVLERRSAWIAATNPELVLLYFEAPDEPCHPVHVRPLVARADRQRIEEHTSCTPS